MPRHCDAYARTLFDLGGVSLPSGQWQPLLEHLKSVADLAAKFARKFDCADWARAAGFWHDLGKYHPNFQALLSEVARGEPRRRVDHSTAGAIHSAQIVGRALNKSPHARRAEFIQLLVTATVAAHHAGLCDGRAELDSRLQEKNDLYVATLAQQPPGEVLLPISKVPALPARLAGSDGNERRLRTEFLIRMVLSALVDADRLDAERFGDTALPKKFQAGRLRSTYASVGEVREAIDAYIDGMVASLDPDRMPATERRVFDYRQAVLDACRAASEAQPGAFSLTVATGGGKTLSSLSFALRHAERHAKDRVIVVIPFTSIIEQTASEYAKALRGLSGNLVEHHSAAGEGHERADEQGDCDADAVRRRLATENWDAPLIVTTAVQFFESLFAATASRCRKLHNIANSVVVIDEAQTLPPGLLNPTIWAINELVEGYGTTVVLSTATQPALERPFPEVRNLRPIVSSDISPPAPRVRLEVLDDAPQSWPGLAASLAEHDQVLCITHQRGDAREVTAQLDRFLKDETTFHLSANMCPAHRSDVIRTIRERLAHRQICRVVSTQLVEAGVDLDFPVVYRALAGIDSLVQAAGRANREGQLGERGGLLRVYRAPTSPPPGLPRIAADACEGLLRAAALDGRTLDLFSPSTGRDFFHRYFERVDDKDGGITPKRREFRFRAVASAYRFIPDTGATVVVPYDPSVSDVLSSIRRYGPSQPALRALQRHVVSVHSKGLSALLSAGAVEALLAEEETEGGAYVLREECTDFYHRRFGLDLTEAGLSGHATNVI